MVRWSTGKMPFFAPASMAMLQMHSRSSIVRDATPGPVNSMLRYSAPSTPICPMMVRITSLPLHVFGSSPVSSKRIAEGTLNQAVPVAMPAAMSVLPTPVENAPRAPYVQVWLSAPMMQSPAVTTPCSGRRACSMPILPTS